MFDRRSAIASLSKQTTQVWFRLGIVSLILSSDSAVAEEKAREQKFGSFPLRSVSFGQPQIVAASLGIVLGRVPAHPVVEATAYSANGVLLQLEPGVGGGKACIGIGTAGPALAFAFKASALRSWGKPWGVEPGQTFVGGEFEFVAFGPRASLGVLRNVSEARKGPVTVFTWAVGWRF